MLDSLCGDMLMSMTKKIKAVENKLLIENYDSKDKNRKQQFLRNKKNQ
jgi:hypothetical protein